jgi:hypothetical protein
MHLLFLYRDNEAILIPLFLYPRWHCVHAMQIERYGLAVATLGIPLKTSVAAADYS